ncbi:MAG TPA: hypothetical protein VH092_19565 [Urbifossiella sp.]|nr:hypothetical protein [Urbifossiella sp.]
MADKITQQIVDALSRAAAEPTGSPLFASKSEAGLFPSAPAGKTAAQKCLADGLLCVAAQNPPAKPGRELYVLSEAGWACLLAASNPRQVLEDFVRVLEARQGEIDELLSTARRTADGIHGLHQAVSRVLPQVTVNRVAAPIQAPPVEPRPAPPADLTDVLLARLSDWAASAQAGEDCPLPDLYRRAGAPSIGVFHDALRRLLDRGSLYLHPWTGPLYAIPEPAFALLSGHGVAYYASLRQDSGLKIRDSGLPRPRPTAAAV